MTASKGERVLLAVRDALEGIAANPAFDLAGVTVERETGLPEEIPADGLIILRDGERAFEETLGGFDPVYVTHTISIEIFAAHTDLVTRNGLYDRLQQAAGAVLLADRTLGGLAHGLTIQGPQPDTEGITGSATVKAAAIPVDIEYDAPSALG